MNENAIRDAYDLFVGTGYTKSYEDFKQLINSNPEALNDAFGLFVSTGYKKDINAFKTLMGVGGAMPAQPEQEQPLKKKEQSGTTVSPSVASSSASQSPQPQQIQQPQELTEQDYFTGAFGDVLRAYDKMVPLGIGDFIDDVARSVSAGYAQGELAEEADRLLLSGRKATPEQIQKFIEANKNLKGVGQSKEAQEFTKIYNEEGGGFWGVVKGLAYNPSYITDVMTSSLVGLATNTDAIAAFGTGVGAGAGGGAAVGSIGAGVGAGPGAVAGAAAAVPYAFGLASSVVEMGSSFAEGLERELNGKPMTKENVKEILENSEKLNSIRNEAIARGVIIGTVDAFTGKLASSVGAKVLTKSAAGSATGAATRKGVVAATAAGSGVEAVGGSVGEATARAATGQEMDTAEIMLEGIAELPGGIRSTLQAKFATPTYKVNGEKVSAKDVDELIQTMTPDQLQKTKIDIENDYEGRKEKIQDKIVTNSIKKEVKAANPDLNETSLNAVTELEKELRKLEGNTTQTGKDKAADIRAKIKDIQANQLEEEVAAEPAPTQKKAVIVADTIKVAPTQVRSDEDIANDIKEELTSNEETKKWSIENEEGDYVSLTGNEDLLAQRVVEALSINPEQRTSDQSRAVNLADRILGPRLLELSNKKSDLSWAENLQSDKIYNLFFENEESIPTELAPMTRETNDDGSVFVKANGGDVKKALGVEAVKQLGNNESVTFTFDSLDQVPEPFREEAEQRTTTFEGREKVLGLPVGKKTSKTVYRVTMTGAEAKKYNVKAPRATTKADIFRNTANSLKTIFPDVKVMTFANFDEMKKAAVENFDQDVAESFAEGTSGAIINDESGNPIAIYVNEESSDATTLPHEVWHGILVKAFGENPKLFAEFRDSIIDTLKKNGFNDVVNQLEEFSQNEAYVESNTQAEEWLVQFGGLLTSAGLSMNNLSPKAKSLMTDIKDILNKIAVKITGQPIFLEDATPENILEFMVTISDSMARGEDLSKFFREGEGRTGGEGMRAQMPSNIRLETIDFENESENIDVYDASEKANQIAKDNGINILRGKDLRSVAVDDNNNVVGGLWTEISDDEFSFDVAIDKESQRKGIGQELVNEAISEFNAQDFDGNLKYKIDVTNPVMEKLLSNYGFEVVERYDGHAIMEHPTNDPKLKSETKAKFQRTLPEGLEIVDGWYSPIEKRLRETKVEKQSANKWLTGGVIGKGDEAIYTGVKGWLESKNPQEQVSKKDILDWMKDNRVEIVEVTKGAKGEEMSQEKMDDVYNSINEQLSRTSQSQEVIDLVQDDLNNWYDNPTDSNYKALDKSLIKANLNLDLFIEDAEERMDDASYYDYQLSGERSNYKEILVTLPSSSLDKNKRIKDLEDKIKSLEEKQINEKDVFKRPAIFKEIQSLRLRLEEAKGDDRIDSIEFQSSHFEEPNILVHLRTNTRTDSNGNKVLFLEEVQSDWGQQGKKEGFKNAETNKELERLREESSIATSNFNKIEEDLYNQYEEKKRQGESRSELRKRDSDFNKLAEQYFPSEQKMLEARKAFDLFQIENRSKVSSAPFVTNTNAWTKLGLKIALREAAKQGADKIAWTTGEQQNKRYDLSKQVDQINVEGVDGNVHLVDIKLSNGTTENLEVENGIIRDGSGVGQRLDSVIGKEYADKVLSTPAGESITLKGQDLKMGGSGMKGFYDKIVPDVFKSLMKEITGNDTAIETVVINGNEQSAISVTPEAKAQVKAGVAKFQRVDAATLQEIKKIAQRYNINDRGFGPKTANEQALARELARFGFSAKRSKPTPEGYGGGIYIVDPSGRKFNPFNVKMQRINLGGGRLKESVTTIEGYDRMLEEANNIIEKSMRRGVPYDKIMDNVMNYVMKSKVYERANDSQREQLVRNVRAEFGKREKSAPSVGKMLVDLFKKLPDPKNITLSEKELLKLHFKDLAKGARDAKKAFMLASDQLSEAIKELKKSGKISTKQLADVVRRFSKVDMLNEESVDRFVDYMTKVFNDAEYAEKIQGIRGKIVKARKNLKSKIGIANAIADPMRKLLAVNPMLIPDEVFNKYVEIIDMFSASGAVLPLNEVNQVAQDINEILQALDEQVSKSQELSIRFENYDNKVVDENTGKVQYAETVNRMAKEDVITAEEAELMKKFKSVIFPKEEKQEKTEAEVKAENALLIDAINNTKVNLDGLQFADERELADNIRRLLKPELLSQLTTAQLNNLIKLIDNINNGYMPHYGELMFEKLNAIKESTPVGDSVSNASPLSISKAYNNLKAKLFGRWTNRSGTSEMIRGGGLFFIDQVLGNFKSKPIFNALWEKISEAQASFQSSLGQVNKKLDTAHDAVAKSFSYNADKTLESSFRMMAYMIQLEYESNPGSKQVNPASAYIRETIKSIKKGNTKYGETEIKMLEGILNENGDVDKDALYKSFNKAEKNAIQTIREINDGLTEKAMFTAAVIRGQRIDVLNNYIHLPVMAEYNPDDSVTATQLSNNYNAALQPSSKGKNLLERTPGAKAINFDVFASAQRGAKFTLLDYHMTSPIRTARKTLNEVENRYGDDFTKQQREIFNAIRNGFEESVSNVLTNNFVATSFGDAVVDFISKQGYRAVLAGSLRFIAELSSNIGFVLFAGRKAFASGLKYFDIISSPDAVNIMENVKSKQITRLYHGDTLSGRFIDQSVLSQTSGVKSTTAKGAIANRTNQIYNMSLKKYKNSIELIADTLISTPDRVVMRPVWFGQFATEFKKQSGVEVDFKKIAEGNEAYMRQYKDAINASKLRADEMSTLTGATDNPFMGILKGTSKANQGVLTRAFNNFNTYMTRFAIYEYTTARQGIYAAVGNGSISRKEGIALLAAVTTRMTVYTLMANMFAQGLGGLLGDEEEEDEKTLMQKLGQAFASTFTSLALGRNFGNFTKSLINFGVEEVNEELLTDLRNGDYDPYKDAISFSAIPKEKEVGNVGVGDFVLNMTGSFSPALKTSDLIFRKAFSKEKKEEDAIERSEKENTIRIPLEVLGNMGMIPLYKDVRKEVINELYKDLRNADKKAADKKQAEKEMLHGYENREDMKRYDPELYEEVFGKNSPGYDAEQAKKKLKHEMDSLERRMKDEFYDYVPKKKGGFGSEGGFGSGSSSGKSKKKGGFGSAAGFGSGGK